MTPVRRRTAGRTGGRALRCLRRVTALALVLVLSACFWSPGRHQNRSHYFGTLLTAPRQAGLEHGKGVQVAHLQIYWDRYETSDGHYSSSYIDGVRRELAGFQRAGSLVEVGLGLNHAPGWLFSEDPQAAYVDQYGNRLTDAPNMVFSRTVRERAQAYIDQVDRAVGLDNFWAIRVGVSDTGEFGYPSATAHGRDDSYWAFDKNAQSPAGADRPASTPANPYPGWRPGGRAYRGRPFTDGQVQAWYDWYLRSLAGAVNWQIDYYRSLHYSGFLKVLVPGSGYYPPDYLRAVHRHLDGTVGNRLIPLGVGFFKTLGEIRDRRNVEIVSTSLVDGTGRPRNNGCVPADSRVDVQKPTRAALTTWSSMRWVSRVARSYGFTLLGGESAGPQVVPYHPGVMADAAHQMRSCGLRGLMWAFDGNLYDGTPGSSLADYSAVIARYG